MKIILRALLISVCSMALVASLSWQELSQAAEGGFEFWTLGELEVKRRSAEDESAVLERTGDVIYRRILIKEEIAADLINGVIDFPSAIRQFLDVTRNLTTSVQAHWIASGRTDEERAARQILDYLRNGRGEQARNLAERLECESAIFWN